jgi:hypothetical protein
MKNAKARETNEVEPLERLAGTDWLRGKDRENFEYDMEQLADILESSARLLSDLGDQINDGKCRDCNDKEITAHLPWGLNETIRRQAEDVRRLGRVAKRLLTPPSTVIPPAELSFPGLQS